LLGADGADVNLPGALRYDEARSVGAAGRIRVLAGETAALLRSTSADRARRRPEPAVWSPLEYACHVRDVLLVQRERVLMMRRGLGDKVVPMGRDERVELDGYRAQDPVDVATQLEQAAVMFEGVLAQLAPDDWDLTVVYNFPVRTEQNLRWVAVHTEHEVAHHLHDIRRDLAS
jgi:hypothetical protein